MLPIVLVLLFGAGLVAALVLAFGALLRHLRRSTAPATTRALTALVGVGGLGAASLAGGVLFVALLATTTATALLQHGPVRSIEILRLDGDALEVSALTGFEGDADEYALGTYRAATEGLDPEYPVHVLVEYRGELRLDRLHRWLERETDGRVHLVGARPAANGDTLLDFGLDLEAGELAEFEDEFEGSQPFFDLPHGVRIELREPGE